MSHRIAATLLTVGMITAAFAGAEAVAPPSAHAYQRNCSDGSYCIAIRDVRIILVSTYGASGYILNGYVDITLFHTRAADGFPGSSGVEFAPYRETVRTTVNTADGRYWTEDNYPPQTGGGDLVLSIPLTPHNQPFPAEGGQIQVTVTAAEVRDGSATANASDVETVTFTCHYAQHDPLGLGPHCGYS